MYEELEDVELTPCTCKAHLFSVVMTIPACKWRVVCICGESGPLALTPDLACWKWERRQETI